MRVVAASLLLLAPLLSGCLLDQLRGLEPEPPAPTVLPWGIADCTFVVAVVPVQASAIQSRLPEGFTPATLAEVGVGPGSDPRGNATLGVEAWLCNQGVAPNGTLVEERTPYGAVFTFVNPPEALRDNESRYHFVKWDVLVPNATARDLLEDAGVLAQAGNVSFPRFETLQDRTAFDATLDLNGTYGLRGTTALPDPASQAFSFVEFSQAAHGLALWRTNVTAATVTAGTGTLFLPGGMAREIVGADRTQAYYLAGTGGAFVNGTVTLPPQPYE